MVNKMKSMVTIVSMVEKEKTHPIHHYSTTEQQSNKYIISEIIKKEQQIKTIQECMPDISVTNITVF